MPPIDRNVPDAVARQVLEEQPNRASWNPELEALFNPNIVARPLHLPISGQIKERKKRDVEFFWALDRCGDKPFHERVEQLKAVGFEPATTEDVIMWSQDNVKGPNEIRSGDRLLMKVNKTVWLSVRKQQVIDALNMSYPTARAGDGKPMNAQNLVPGVKSEVVGDENIDKFRSQAIVSDAREELATGDVQGNASVVDKHKIHKDGKGA
jgi:hypothetical protein